MKTITILKPIKIIATKTTFSAVVFFLFVVMLTNTVLGIGENARGAVINAASCEHSDVQAAINSASDGDTVIIPEGTCTWSSRIIIDKAMTLQGMGADLTKLINDHTDVLMIKIDLASDVPVRVTGIYFDSGTNDGSDRYAIKVNGKTDGSFALTQLRIDHNTFEKGKRTVYIKGWVEGLIDNNTFINCDMAVSITGDNTHSWSRPIEAGTANSLFIEDNLFLQDNDSDVDLNEQVYHQEGGRSVTRYNTFDLRSYTVYAGCPFESHGNFNYYGEGWDMRGQPLIEIYNNNFYIYDSYRVVYMRGGSLLAYDNTITLETGSGSIFKLSEEESWQTVLFDPLATEWNAEDQIMNSFFWDNTLNGSPITDVSLNYASDSTFIQKDRDYFMHAPESSGGKVTYDSRAGGAATFSNSGPNAYYPYTPYTYPHPLRGESGPNAISPTRSNPDNFTLQQNYPNPFNPSTTIKYSVVKPCNVQIIIYNQLGQEVYVLVNEQKPAGKHNVRWDGKDAKGNKLASGVYFYRLTAGKQADTKRMLYLR